jgi:hypothetical protein
MPDSARGPFPFLWWDFEHSVGDHAAEHSQAGSGSETINPFLRRIVYVQTNHRNQNRPPRA